MPRKKKKGKKKTGKKKKAVGTKDEKTVICPIKSEAVLQTSGRRMPCCNKFISTCGLLRVMFEQRKLGKELSCPLCKETEIGAEMKLGQFYTIANTEIVVGLYDSRSCSSVEDVTNLLCHIEGIQCAVMDRYIVLHTTLEVKELLQKMWKALRMRFTEQSIQSMMVKTSRGEVQSSMMVAKTYSEINDKVLFLTNDDVFIIVSGTEWTVRALRNDLRTRISAFMESRFETKDIERIVRFWSRRNAEAIRKIESYRVVRIPVERIGTFVPGVLCPCVEDRKMVDMSLRVGDPVSVVIGCRETPHGLEGIHRSGVLVDLSETEKIGTVRLKGLDKPVSFPTYQLRPEYACVSTFGLAVEGCPRCKSRAPDKRCVIVNVRTKDDLIGIAKEAVRVNRNDLIGRVIKKHPFLHADFVRALFPPAPRVPHKKFIDHGSSVQISQIMSALNMATIETTQLVAPLLQLKVDGKPEQTVSLVGITRCFKTKYTIGKESEFAS